jgi:hypothetical protein
MYEVKHQGSEIVLFSLEGNPRAHSPASYEYFMLITGLGLSAG